LGGGARANQFRVDLNFPTFVGGGQNAGRKAQFLCKSASLPGSHIGISSVFYRGREVKLAGERQFQNWGVSIINDTDFAIRDAFESWMNSINDVKENVGITNPGLYTVDMTVTQLDRNGASLKTYTFAGAFPVEISDIQLDFQNNDQVEEFQVQFAYAFWQPNTNQTSIGGSVGINTPFGGVGVKI
jgi:hypothetical protein